MEILVLLGLILILGLAAGRLLEKIGIPQVVGYILMGVLLGDSVSHTLPMKLLDQLSTLTYVALAFIGYTVGGELKLDIFRQYGRQFFIILFCEGLLSMAIVSGLIYFWTQDPALSILLGALSSATAPAATVDVLWQYRSRGPLTTTILAIVALDDGLALILYGFAFAFAGIIVGGGALNWHVMLVDPFVEIFGALLLGGAIGLVLDRASKLVLLDEHILVVNLGAVLLAAGAALYFNLSLILTSMALGLVMCNLREDHNARDFALIKSFAPPIYIIFFIFVGARLQIGLLPTMGMVSVLYVVGRTAGKWAGSYGGARLAKSPDTVRDYLGFALFSQAGVAIGLALDIYRHFSQFGAAGEALGHTIIGVIAATTFVVQIVGPPSVKYAITKAGEIPEEQPAGSA